MIHNNWKYVYDEIDNAIYKYYVKKESGDRFEEYSFNEHDDSYDYVQTIFQSWRSFTLENEIEFDESELEKYKNMVLNK